jgi:hypothetical protein
LLLHEQDCGSLIVSYGLLMEKSRRQSGLCSWKNPGVRMSFHSLSRFYETRRSSFLKKKIHFFQKMLLAPGKKKINLSRLPVK